MLLQQGIELKRARFGQGDRQVDPRKLSSFVRREVLRQFEPGVEYGNSLDGGHFASIFLGP